MRLKVKNAGLQHLVDEYTGDDGFERWTEHIRKAILLAMDGIGVTS